ncbi:MAG TPA: protein-glutamine glutaminase family protein [Thermoanaerobaculia bacterium]
MKTVVGSIDDFRSEVGTETVAGRGFPFGQAEVTIAGRTLTLDAEHPAFETWSRVLHRFALEQRPVFAAFDEDTGQIATINLPERLVAEAVREAQDGCWVDFEHSHAHHLLRSTHPRYGEYRDLLRSSAAGRRVLLVTDDILTDQIISLREAGTILGPGLTVVDGKAREQDGSALQEISPEDARELFAYILKMSAELGDGFGPRIPFDYPEDGCWARANEMCRVIAAAGVAAAKVWNWGKLEVRTTNSPKCRVRWGWHVAPVVRVAHPSGAVNAVLDPSMFDEPVASEQWIAAQGTSEATAITPAEIFWRNRDGSRYSLDNKPPGYSATMWQLGYYSARRDVRIEALHGQKPPYPCPA